jgi:hypothetical protein
LEQISEATATREVLELLLDTFHVVSKVWGRFVWLDSVVLVM